MFQIQLTMKRLIPLLFSILSGVTTMAQIGVGTTSPNSTLDVRGSLSAKYTAFTSATTAGTDNLLVFTGTSATTLTLPDATTCQGRYYWIKNKSSNSSALTIATTSSQTIDGLSTWLLSVSKATRIVSDGSNWLVTSETVPGSSSNSWLLGGNGVASVQQIGTTSNYDFPVITNNSEKMRVFSNSTGSVSIGSDTLDPYSAEKLRIDGGTTDNYNLIGAYGNRSGYLQFNIQNKSSGGQASTDIVATADNGTETANYVDLGINSSNYNNGSSSLLNGANNSYLYSKGQDFVIGNASTSKSIIFFTGGDAPSNEKFRINSSGVVMKSNVLPAADNSYNLGSSTYRWATIYSNNSLNTSDARLKTNIRNLNYGLSAILKMRSVQYNWKEGADQDTKIGFLAQELRNVIPEVVVGDERKENLAVNYIELIPIMVNAIKEQQQQIEELKKEISNLKRKH